MHAKGTRLSSLPLPGAGNGCSGWAGLPLDGVRGRFGRVPFHAEDRVALRLHARLGAGRGRHADVVHQPRDRPVHRVHRALPAPGLRAAAGAVALGGLANYRVADRRRRRDDRGASARSAGTALVLVLPRRSPLDRRRDHRVVVWGRIRASSSSRPRSPDIWVELLHPDDREVQLAAHDQPAWRTPFERGGQASSGSV